jgi:hypothetical protein
MFLLVFERTDLPVQRDELSPKPAPPGMCSDHARGVNIPYCAFWMPSQRQSLADVPIGLPRWMDEKRERRGDLSDMLFELLAFLLSSWEDVKTREVCMKYSSEPIVPFYSKIHKWISRENVKQLAQRWESPGMANFILVWLPIMTILVSVEQCLPSIPKMGIPFGPITRWMPIT